MTKQEFINTLVTANQASLEMVKELVAQIEEPKEETITMTRETLDTIVYEIVKNITSLGTDLVSSYELSMSYNHEVELDDVTIDEDEIESIIKAVIEEHVDINED